MYKILANTLFLGKEIIYLPTCHSTNDVASGLVSNSATMEGTFVITDDQTKGKGQRGNTWLSQKDKNLMFSLILRPVFLDPMKQFYLNMISSLAVMRTVQHFLPNEMVRVKWPNDVLVGTKKVAGILIENSLSSAGVSSSVFGIGLNVNQTDFQGLTATSMAERAKVEFDKQQVLEVLFSELERLYLSLRKGDESIIKEEYLRNLYGYGAPVKLYSEYEFDGQIIKIDDSGLIQIKEGTRLHTFDFKQVRFILS